MGMPGLVYRWYFRAHSLKSLERNILGFVGIKPVKETLIGAVETCGSAQRRKWLDKLAALTRGEETELASLAEALAIMEAVEGILAS